ncbi:DUF423 domain-containing protein [Arenimonas oryziterrae]|uniref:DUF423 domain-containing protein n=1 Tax=Arenimonas oryziterrae DSM 21050 = YC6267 TaxID=1121015 RepID=A0A091B1I9_9GAMM|nr:DUF423 domain-containing protein [Arenimonas oryziterrae]KFN44774.1 hypothetical protein N789_01815 [Arenimonas oryziterrae DSM 21050 = YC6267]
MRGSRVFAAVGALCCGASVALGAYASHAAQGPAKERLALAALFAFAHGLALIVLMPRTSRLATVAKGMWVSGIGLFSGSLASAALFGTPTTFAPAGGSLLILAWVIVAADLIGKD